MINVSVGGCGVRLGVDFWKDVSDEYGLDGSGRVQGGNGDLSRLQIHYNELNSGYYRPRSVMVDLGNDSEEYLKSFQSLIQFDRENCIFGCYGTGNSWPKGFYTDGAEIIDSVLEVIRKETEKCEVLQGFQIFHSLGGGTGSGTGSLLLSKLKELYPSELLTTFSVFPSAKVSDCVIEPYNALLSIFYLIENSDGVMVIDNEALYEMCFRRLKISSPVVGDLNYLARMAMSGATCFYRFPVEGVNSLGKLVTNLVPEPRLHFFTMALAPLLSRGSTLCQLPTVSSLTSQIQSPTNSFCTFDPLIRKNLASLAIYRGKMESEEIYNEFFNIKTCFDINNSKFSICGTHFSYIRKSCTLISNSSAVTVMFDRLISIFSHMFRRKAYIYGYCREGMDEMELTEAESNLRDLISEYDSIGV